MGSDQVPPARVRRPRRLSLIVGLVLVVVLVVYGTVFTDRLGDAITVVLGGELEGYERDRHLALGGPGFNTENLTLPRDRILYGGPPKNGIPSLTDPPAVAAAEAEFLDPGDRVVGLTVNDQSRAYPIRLLNWHEAVNDTVGEIPIAVIYCPLCDSVSVVDRRLDAQTFEFGVSGLLHNSNVLLYDRTDDALWSQVGLTAVSGPHAGRSLDHLEGWQITTFRRWQEQHPDSTVVSFDTGHQREYDRNPYGSYFRTSDLYFPVEPQDPSLRRKDPVIGVSYRSIRRAYPIGSLAEAPGGELRDDLGGGTLLLRVAPDGSSVEVVEAPPGAKVVHTFWFAWYAFHPETEIHGR